MTSHPLSSTPVWKVCGRLIIYVYPSAAALSLSFTISLTVFTNYVSKNVVFSIYCQQCMRMLWLYHYKCFCICLLCCRCGGPVVLTGWPPCSGRDGKDTPFTWPILSAPHQKCHCQVLQHSGWTHLHTGNTSTGDKRLCLAAVLYSQHFMFLFAVFLTFSGIQDRVPYFNPFKKIAIKYCIYYKWQDIPWPWSAHHKCLLLMFSARLYWWRLRVHSKKCDLSKRQTSRKNDHSRTSFICLSCWALNF